MLAAGKRTGNLVSPVRARARAPACTAEVWCLLKGVGRTAAFWMPFCTALLPPRVLRCFPARGCGPTLQLPYCPEFFRKEFTSAIADMKNHMGDRSNSGSRCVRPALARQARVNKPPSPAAFGHGGTSVA